MKKGKSRLNSLNEFRNHNKKDIAIKVSSNQYGYNEENQLLTLPFYYFSFYLNDIADYINYSQFINNDKNNIQ